MSAAELVDALDAAGYEDAILLRAGAVCDTFSAHHDRHNIVVKVLRPSPTDNATTRYWARSFRREGEYLDAWADIDGLVRAVAVNVPLTVGPTTTFCHALRDAGGDLEGQSFHPAVAVSMMTRVAATVATVHELGFVHRDVKPANIFACGSDIVLGDLGTAAPIASEHREHFHRYLYPYTALFAAPELFAGFGVEQDTYLAADVWSIGATTISLCMNRSLLPLLLSPQERAAMVRAFSMVRGRAARNTAYLRLQPVLQQRLTEALSGMRHELRPALGAAAAQQMVDLLSELLVLDPTRRSTARDACRHFVELRKDRSFEREPR